VNRLFEFHKTRQPFIGAYNEPLSVAAMRVSNPDRLPVGIDRRDSAPTPSGFNQIVSDDLPIAFHGAAFCLFCSPYGNGKVI
jgi:hypothetical protein